MKWYVINYDPQPKKGCPGYLKGKLNRSWEWNDSDPDPFKLSISNDYVFESQHNNLDFDFWISGPLVSKKFIEVCEKFQAKYRPVRVKIIQANGASTDKEYFYMLFSGRFEILNYEESRLKFDINLKTGEVVHHKKHPSTPFVYSVYKAVIDENKFHGEHIFRCLDLSRDLICSEIFKAECEEKRLKGLKFTEIDENFHEIGIGDTDHPEMRGSMKSV